MTDNTAAGDSTRKTGYAWGLLIGSEEWLTIPGSHWDAPPLTETPQAARRPYAEADTLALVERWWHPGVGSGRAFRIIAIVPPSEHAREATGTAMDDSGFAASISPAARAARWVPENPHPLCRDFTPKPPPSAFWCAHCNWNEPMHADETTRAAIADELRRIGGAA